MPGAWWSRIRNYLYDKGYLYVAHSSAFVISIGNLTWGGTGKTSLTSQIAGQLISEGYRLAIISRGYRRRSKGLRVVNDGKRILLDWQDAGDEPYWLASNVPEAIVLVSEDRTEALRWLEKDPPQVILLDDGFQNRKIARDLDLVLVDASENLLNQKVIPFGKLREPLDSLKRADALILTHSSKAQIKTLEWIESSIAEPIFHANYVPVSAESVGATVGNVLPNRNKWMKWSGQKLAAFCALGAPHHFFKMLEDHGAELVFRKAYRDHHAYTIQNLEELQAESIITDAEALITTERDALKITKSWLRVPLIAVNAELQLEEEQSFFDLIRERILAKETLG
jgi:tetraacyldisaccharide 4'-kinase